VARRIRRIIGPMGAREQDILRAVIEEYVSTAVPVGSQALVDKYALGVSSATVRNVLAELEAFGLLSHPHTSAGRVPTDMGYRYYVESIAESVQLPPVEQLMIRHQFGQVEFASEHWFRLAATTLASVTRAAGLATPAKPASARIRRVDIVSMQERLASLILVLREGTVKQLMVNLPAPVSQDELSRVAGLLNEHCHERTGPEIARRLDRIALPELVARVQSAELSAGGGSESGGGSDSGAGDNAAGHVDDRLRVLARRLAERIVRAMQEFDASLFEDLFSDGLLNVLAAPEFAQSDKVRRVFAALENRIYLGDLVGVVAGSGRVQVFIGAENPAIDMREVSLVLAPYGRPGRAVGVVGVLGPTRMSYGHAIGTVNFISGLMNELVDHLYA
jgi:heat-inducible transcriptional repressor